MKFQRGAVVLIRFPFSNLVQSKIRPALVVSSENFNRGQDLILASISSHPGCVRFSVPISQHDLLQGTLREESFIKCGQLLAAEKRLILKVVGMISTKKLEEARRIIISRIF